MPPYVLPLVLLGTINEISLHIYFLYTFPGKILMMPNCYSYIRFDLFEPFMDIVVIVKLLCRGQVTVGWLPLAQHPECI